MFRRRAPTTTTNPTRVLVVDDEPAICKLLLRWLRQWGFAAEPTNSASQALELMMANPADILLCDIHMPGCDGLALAEKVRANWPKTAIIMATAVQEIPAVVKSRQLGAVDYVTKPFQQTLLLQALQRAIETRART